MIYTYITVIYIYKEVCIYVSIYIVYMHSINVYCVIFMPLHRTSILAPCPCPSLRQVADASGTAAERVEATERRQMKAPCFLEQPWDDWLCGMIMDNG